LRPPPSSPLLPSTTLFRSLHAVADAQVASHAHLAAQHDVLAHIDRARHAHKRDEQAMLADGGAVADGNQVSKLGALADTGFAQRDRKSTRLNSSHVKISYA